jgi:2-dehydro-3-deoxy-D-arabinonate dehydratase
MTFRSIKEKIPMSTIIRYHEPGAGARLGVCDQAGAVHDLTDLFGTWTAWLQSSVGMTRSAVQGLAETIQNRIPTCRLADIVSPPQSKKRYLLAPIENQEVWAAGVTYERSREARQEEAADGGDVYARVYTAQRPELFFKSYGEKVVGPGAAVGIRRDATWSVPEAELAVVLNPALELVGFSIGNDMSSRDIEGSNPLYLPQAKIYTAACALGPHILLATEPEWPSAKISIRIQRGRQEVFYGETHTRQIHRSLADLLEHLGRSNYFPNGVVLLTGTGIVPPAEVSLQAGDQVTIEIEGIGELRNPVRLV